MRPDDHWLEAAARADVPSDTAASPQEKLDRSPGAVTVGSWSTPTSCTDPSEYRIAGQVFMAVADARSEA